MINKSGASWLLHALISPNPIIITCILPLVSSEQDLHSATVESHRDPNSVKLQLWQIKPVELIKQSEGPATVLGSIILDKTSKKLRRPVRWWSGGNGNNHLVRACPEKARQYFHCIKTIRRESVRGGEHVGRATPLVQTKRPWRELKSKFSLNC